MASCRHADHRNHLWIISIYIPTDRAGNRRYYSVLPGSSRRESLSDHADYSELLRYVELVKPDRVFTVHGFAREFANDLRARGIEAWSLEADNQLELLLPPEPPVTPSRSVIRTVQPNEGGFSRFV